MGNLTNYLESSVFLMFFCRKSLNLDPRKDFFEDNKLKICNKFDLRSKIAGVIPEEEINKGITAFGLCTGQN